MGYQISIRNTGHRFEAEAGESILQAALRAGLALPHGCRDGACGSCKGKLIEGAADLGNYSVSALTEAERQAGLVLFCQAAARSDLVIEAREVLKAGDIPVRTLPSRVQRIERPTDDVAILYLKLPANERLRFLPGQYLDILLKGGVRRGFSMANTPDADELELHVRHVPGGVFTDYVFNRMKERDIVRFDGPHGTFFLREDSAKPMVLVAGGTGFAPIKSLIAQALANGIARPMTLYWGARRPRDLYQGELPLKWAAGHANFRYIPVVSDALPEDAWTGRTGLVHRAVMEDFSDLSGYQAYVCGVPIMVDVARREFIEQRKLPEEEFFADSFTTSADRAGE
ncbi:MAG: CDP-6-deoxy-delta-3,4-glucoseen reductase [Betaproteobacteria bacterium]|nr:CDP-6-deoxy-delta-3,4-glucoseen reductase [Betaproteobacteria bacterium]MBI2961369.1 CDP-6-deoxy-delta-3,4-glucoseen reductase [Betaproteobacteria bacterium]